MTSPLLPTKLVWKLKTMSMKKKMSTTESTTSILTSVLLLDVLRGRRSQGGLGKPALYGCSFEDGFLEKCNLTKQVLFGLLMAEITATVRGL